MATEPTEITGKVVNGVVVLDQPGRLEDGTTVRVQPLDKNSEARGNDINFLREMLLSHAGVIQHADLPPDLAENLDHYLYARAVEITQKLESPIVTTAWVLTELANTLSASHLRS